MQNYSKILISLVLACTLFYFTEWQKLINAIRGVELSYYLLSLSMLVISNIISAFLFYILIKDSAVELSVFKLFKINMITFYYSIFLPTSISVDAVRWYRITKNKAEKLFTLAVTIFTRLVLLVVILFFVFLTPFINQGIAKNIATLHQINLFGAFMMMISLCLILIMISGKCNRLIRKKIDCLIPKYSAAFNEKIDSLLLKKITIKSLSVIGGLSLLLHVSSIYRIYFITKSLSLPFEFTDIMWIGSVALIVQLLPIKYSGIGIREGYYAFILGQYGYASEQGIAVGLILFSQLVILAVIGFLIEIHHNYYMIKVKNKSS